MKFSPDVGLTEIFSQNKNLVSGGFRSGNIEFGINRAKFFYLNNAPKWMKFSPDVKLIVES